MHGGVTSGAPTGPAAQECRVRSFTDENLAAKRRHLCVTFQAQVVVALHQHLVRDRPVRLMADDATFAQRLMLENHRARLLAMAFGATFVQARHACRRPDAERCAMRRFHDVRAVRIMALHAIHSPFQHGMMLRQFELRMNLHMTGKTRLRIAPGVHNQPASAAGLYVQAPRAMARFASGGIRVRRAFDMQAYVRARRKHASELAMAINACFVADECCSFDLWRPYHTLRNGGTRSQNQGKHGETRQDG